MIRKVERINKRVCKGKGQSIQSYLFVRKCEPVLRTKASEYMNSTKKNFVEEFLYE